MRRTEPQKLWHCLQQRGFEGTLGQPNNAPQHSKKALHAPAVSMSSAHMQRRQLGLEGPEAQPSRGALTSFSLVLLADAQTGTGNKYVPSHGFCALQVWAAGSTVPPVAHIPVHSTDCRGEKSLQPQDKGFHQPVDASLFWSLGAIR